MRIELNKLISSLILLLENFVKSTKELYRVRALSNTMKRILALYIIINFLIGCNSNEQSKKVAISIKSDSIKLDSVPDDKMIENKFIDFPIPDLDSIFPYFETSGAVAISPSEKFYNPTDSGIFVFYTLFDKKKVRDSKYSFDEQNIGTLTTHTYRKPKYGWSDTDDDQTFILLQLDGKPIMIGKSIQVGISLNKLILELGNPIYQSDSTFTFLGKNKIIGQFSFDKGKLRSLTYGRYNLSDNIFEIDSISRKEIIEEKLKRKN